MWKTLWSLHVYCLLITIIGRSVSDPFLFLKFQLWDVKNKVLLFTIAAVNYIGQILLVSKTSNNKGTYSIIGLKYGITVDILKQYAS